ncbi:TPA: hypothetical protein ONC18_000453 [Enterobacter kobei]|nr:hypothetical protein [Enterobacter kobei]
MNNTSLSFAEIEQRFLHSDVKVLSLDCFDTLYWRYVSRPFDIFTRIQHGLCPSARSKAESRARGKKYFTTGKDEVTIAEIYAELSSQFDSEEQKKIIEYELTQEIEHGFLFPPALALLRKAKERGIRTIIVSDIYYNSEQLSRLLSAHSDEIPTLIDKVYCSAEFGHGKTTKLWPEIVHQEQIAPQDIFHVGDNFIADYQKPAKLGVNAVHFKQFEKPIVNVLEQRAVAANILFPSSRATAPIPSLFHACYSVALRGDISSEKLTAWTMLGPVMYAFARFIKQQRDKTPGVKLGFLMRDGYMPREAYQTLYPQDSCGTLRISRFTAICSSFHNRESIASYLSGLLHEIVSSNERITQEGFGMIAKHLMVKAEESQKIQARLEELNYSAEYLYESLLADEIVQETLARSADFRRRLIAHLRNELDIVPGDTLMLVDLGYSGTAQNLLASLLEKELDIKVRGCYMISVWIPGWHKNRAGMINPDNADFRLISTLIRFIASVEMLCSSHDFSVTDYSEEGQPTGKSDKMSPLVLPKIRQIQQQALDCIRMAAELNIPASQSLWDAATIDLARYIYLPLAGETKQLEELTFDINMGTDVVTKMADIHDAIDYMRRYGISRLTLGEDTKIRTNYPSELRSCGIEYALSTFVSSRYAISWSLANSTQRKQALQTMFVLDQQRTECRTINATSTFDGYFSLYIPQVTPEVVVLMGKTLRDFEIFSISLVPQHSFYKESENRFSHPLKLNQDYFIDGATLTNNLVLNMSDEGFIYFRLQQIPMKSVIHIVYRPLNMKSSSTPIENC